MLLGFHQVFAPFLDCVHSFGFRTSEDDGIWNGYRRSTQPVAAERGCRSRDPYRRSRDPSDHPKLRHTLTPELIHRFQDRTNHYSYNSQTINKSLIIAMPSIKETDAYVAYQALKTRPDWHPSWVKNEVSKALIVTWINPELIED